MTKKQTTEPKVVEPIVEDSPVVTPTEPREPVTAEPTKHPKGYVTEDSYVGLQRVIAKRDGEIETLNTKFTELTTQFEELKVNTGGIEGQRDTLEKQLTDTKDNLDTITAERDTYNTQLSQQSIVMKEFPQLSKLATFIPPAEDDAQFRTNAQGFLDALGTVVDSEVANVVSGASAQVNSVTTMVDESEEDKAWDEVYSLAGKEGKEKEYDKANDRLQQILSAKQQ